MKVRMVQLKEFNETGLKLINEALKNYANAINFIEFVVGGEEENVFSTYASFTAPSIADTEFSIAHTLNRTPIGYIVISRTAPAVVYDGTTTNTSGTLYLRSDTADVSGTILII